MNAKEFVQIVKKMFSKGLTPEEKIKLADEGPVCRLLLRQWDKFFGTSIENKKIEEEIWTNITDVCWNHKPAKKKTSRSSAVWEPETVLTLPFCAGEIFPKHPAADVRLPA